MSLTFKITMSTDIKFQYRMLVKFMSVDIVILNVSDIFMSVDIVILNVSDIFMSVEIVILNVSDILCLWTL